MCGGDLVKDVWRMHDSVEITDRVSVDKVISLFLLVVLQNNKNKEHVKNV